MQKLNEGHAKLSSTESKSNLIRLIDVFPRLATVLGYDLERSPENTATCTQAFAIAGNNVIPKPPRQNSSNIEALYAQAKEAFPHFTNMIKDLTRKSGAIEYMDPGDLLKKAARTYSKARDDYKGDTSRVCDILRTSIIVDSPSQIRKLANLLRPANNPSVVRYEDSFAKPDEDGSLRRILANVRLPNGHVCEIQVRHKGMEAAYKETIGLYHKARAAKAWLGCNEQSDTDSMMNTHIVNAQKKLNHFLSQRVHLHEKAAKRHNLDQLILDRNFFLVDQFPVMQVHDKWADEWSAVVPDPKSGKYVTDNSFLPLLSSRDHKVENVGKEIFIARSSALITSDGVRAHLKIA